MEQTKGITQTRKGKHLNRNERILIEGFLRAGSLRPEGAPDTFFAKFYSLIEPW